MNVNLKMKNKVFVWGTFLFRNLVGKKMKGTEG